jgi:hypothetical protein
LVAAIATTSAVGIAPRISRLAAVPATALRLNRCEVEEAIDGNTIQNIGAGHHIAIERRRIGLGVLLAVIPLPTAKPVRGNNSADRVEIWLAAAVGERA